MAQVGENQIYWDMAYGLGVHHGQVEYTHMAYDRPATSEDFDNSRQSLERVARKLEDGYIVSSYNLGYRHGCENTQYKIDDRGF